MKKLFLLIIPVLLVSTVLAVSCTSPSPSTTTTTSTATTPITTFTPTTTTTTTTFTPTTSPPTTTTTTTETETTTTTTAENVVVLIQDFAFSPSTITVNVGSTVTWVNHDSVSHTVTSDTGLFDSSTLSNGGSFSFTFTAPGTYNYHCSFHSSMHGTIVVN